MPPFAHSAVLLIVVGLFVGGLGLLALRPKHAVLRPSALRLENAVVLSLFGLLFWGGFFFALLQRHDIELELWYGLGFGWLLLSILAYSIHRFWLPAALHLKRDLTRAEQMLIATRIRPLGCAVALLALGVGMVQSLDMEIYFLTIVFVVFPNAFFYMAYRSLFHQSA